MQISEWQEKGVHSIQTNDIKVIRALHHALYGRAYHPKANQEWVVFRSEGDAIKKALASLSKKNTEAVNGL